MEVFLRFSSPRPYQDKLIGDILQTISEGKHLLANAPTGIGKTDAAFAATIPYIIEHKKVLLFLSPKISQHDMALKVLKGIYKKYGVLPHTTEVIGKRYLCIHPLASRVEGEDFYEVCKKLKEREECPFYKNFILNPRYPEAAILDRNASLKFGRTEELCPHEVAFNRLKRSPIIIADYYHLFSPRVRDIFLKKIGREMKDVILIIDEAHNLPDRIRSVLSASLSIRTVERAIKEASRVDKELEETLHSLRNTMEDVEREKLLPSDILGDFQDEDLWESLIERGKEFLDITNRSRSAMLTVGRFLKGWFEGEEGYVRYMTEDGKLIKRNLDPAVEAKLIFEEVHASILMSGTLTPPEMYRDLLGLEEERTVIREYPSPFPRENRLVLVVPTLTTRYSKRKEEEFRRYGEMITEVVDAIPGNVATFFPSYDVLKSVLPFIHTNKPIFVQEEGMKPSQLEELLASFKSMKDRGALLLGVAGGSLSEGVDYPGKELVGVILVGVPLSEMNVETAALIEYYEKKMGRGWTYGYIYPAMVKVLQSMGRLIRSEDDRGVIILMDERYTWENYKRFLPRDAITTTDPTKYITHFFRK